MPLAGAVLGADPHPKRLQGFLYSREALRLILCSLNLPSDINSLVLTNYHSLKHSPEIVLSLSHTPGAGAAILGFRNHFRSIGIDVENENRVVSSLVKEKIAHPEDYKLRNIEMWCLKEAAFKCLMNTDLFEQNVRFADIQIQKDTWSHAPSGLHGALELTQVDSFVLALATLSA